MFGRAEPAPSDEAALPEGVRALLGDVESVERAQAAAMRPSTASESFAAVFADVVRGVTGEADPDAVVREPDAGPVAFHVPPRPAEAAPFMPVAAASSASLLRGGGGRRSNSRIGTDSTASAAWLRKLPANGVPGIATDSTFMPGEASSAVSIAACGDESFSGTGALRQGATISASSVDCQCRATCCDNVLMRPVMPTTSIQAASTTPVRLCRSSQ